MKITRSLLAILALASFSVAFAGGTDAHSMPASTHGAEALCAMSRVKTENKAPVAMPIDSWYLETADDLSAKARQPMTCKGSQGHMNHAKNDIKADAATRDAWYLQTADDIRAAANQPMSCNAAQSCMTDAS